MNSFMLTNWVTIRGATSIASVTQSQSGWLDLTGFQDVVAWLDVREANANGGTNVTMTYQTCPTADEVMFAAVTAAFNITSGTVTVTPMLKETTTVPLSRWLRWQLGVTGTPTGAWDASFRISDCRQHRVSIEERRDGIDCIHGARWTERAGESKRVRRRLFEGPVA